MSNEIYSPRKKSNALFKKNKFYSEINEKQEVNGSEHEAKPIIIINAQRETWSDKIKNFVAEKAKTIFQYDESIT